MPPIRMWFVLAGTLLSSFAGLMGGAFAQAMGDGNRLHLYSYLYALCVSVPLAIVAARMAWSTTPVSREPPV